MNKVILNGNLVRDMEVRQTKGGTDVGEFTIANNIGYGEDVKTLFVKCTLFGKRVEALQKYLLKGCRVLIDGQLEINNYHNEKEDTWTTYVNIVVNDIDILKFVEVEEDTKYKRKRK